MHGRRQSCPVGIAAVLVAVSLAGAPAAATTATVGRQSLTGFSDYFHCQSDAGSSCTNVFSQTSFVSAGGIATVPADGTITGWRVVGSCIVGYGWCDHTLRVLRPDFFGLKMKFVASSTAIHTIGYCDRCAPLDGTLTTISPGIPVQAGDYIAVDEAGSNSADVRVMIASAMGATYNLFSGYIADGTSVTPTGGGDWEPLFDADVALDPPAPGAVDSPSGPTGGGQTVTVTGDHLAGATHVRFDGVEASAVTAVSNTRVTAVTPPHGAGTADVTVTTPGGTSDPSVAMRYTYSDATVRRSSVYVTHIGEIWQYDVDPLGLLTAKAPTTVLVQGDGPYGIALHPNGRSAYAFEGLNHVRQFDVGPEGALAPKTPATVASGNGPWSIAISADGRSAYVANSGTADISQYDVGADGSLAPKTPASVPAGGDPLAVAVSPDGHTVYAADYSGGKVFQYDADPAGALSPKVPAFVPAGSGAGAIALSPDGSSAYVADQGIDSVSQYDVSATGALSPKTPATVATGDAPRRIALSPDGRSLYVVDAASDAVSQYDVGPGGALSPKTPATVGTGSEPFDVVVSPDGRSVYVTDDAGGTVSQYDAGAAGTLSAKSRPLAAAGEGPVAIALLPDQGPVAAFDASGGGPGRATAFDASASHDADGSIDRYDWEFGDGAVAHDAGPRPTHVYATAGTYSVTLTVTDDIGCSLAVVFTGATAYCNGSPAARTTRSVSVTAGGGASAGTGAQVFAGVPAAITVGRNGGFAVTLHVASWVRGRAVWRSVRRIRVRRGSAKRRRVTLAVKSFTVPAGGNVRLKVKLSRRSLRILRLNRRIRTRLTLTLTDAAGRKTTLHHAMTFRAPRRRHR